MLFTSAEFEINIPSAIRQAIADVHRERSYTLATFDAAYENILSHVLTDGFSRFIDKLEKKKRETMMTLQT